MTANSALIELIAVKKRFGDFQLEDINIDLYKGEIHVLVGENGTGKSTLMKMIGGWFPQDEGVILYKGIHYSFSSISEAVEGGILYLHQDLQNFENLTVAENIFFRTLSGRKKAFFYFNPEKIQARCLSVFKELNIKIDPQARLGSLGFAEKQLISAVRAYVSKAEVIIFDEPSSAMGDPEREILFNIVRALKQRGTAIFYISHRLDEIQTIGDRVSVLDRGTIGKTCICSEVGSQGIVEMMIGEVHRERYPRLSSRKGRTLLNVENLTHSPILKGVSFSLRKGEIVGITGLMGSGRTLLAKCLFGIVKPEEGAISVRGMERRFNHPLEAMEAGISLIPEDRMENGIFSIHTVKTNMTSAALKRFVNKLSLDDRFIYELTGKYVDELSIAPGHADDVVRNYSGGNMQKILIGRWLMQRSPIYIMDEPTRGIDAASKVDIYNTMNDIVEKGGAILLISSEIEEILGMCDRILVLAGGKIKGEMSREEASKEKILRLATDESG
ncbi:sugar ABC transporter ATP-binding protein [Spirochaeta isovalerica]|uniref:Ribose transport system ATP-binding protein n=2 Tax=Spirochaeta isovalerica TaxID=150 RepID=A0A841R7F0_9SPIO|nr:sugar ABC transporter ATP-binding protein [Spirochaeta isovalerica]MBB6479756.1 ribose transport system ATP-binding protein [Spirochaeta isovalerica]